MATVEINYIVNQPDVNDDLVSELERAIDVLRSEDDMAGISSSLDYEGQIAMMTVRRIEQIESEAQYQHRADVLATAVLDRCSDEARGKVQATFAGIMPPDVQLYQE